jgi:hypothetical protein
MFTPDLVSPMPKWDSLAKRGFWFGIFVKGSWNGVALDGLSVIAVVLTDQTMGDVQFRPRKGRSVMIVDSKANKLQRDALIQFAASRAGDLVSEIVSVQTSSIEAQLGACTKSGCSAVKAEGLVEVTTRCVGKHDHICGNEELYYPPIDRSERCRGCLYGMGFL